MRRGRRVADVLAFSTRYLRDQDVPDARVDAELLLAHVLGIRLEDLIARSTEVLSPAHIRTFNRAVARRGAREPLAYITGVKEFYGIKLKVTPSVLIPRPETEILVERAIALRPKRVLDLGTGSGAIAAALAAALPDAEITATDVSAAAIGIARQNLPRRVVIRRGPDFEPVKGEKFDLVVSNPPYIPTGEVDGLQAEVRQEPRVALDGGRDGLDLVRQILREAPRALVEIGFGQAKVLRSEFRGVRFHK
ncbi:MAG TPA: peptide chain release factor N(5)-glutamine methyltransferase, partial [Planctomycetota bacterium]|nr:peptide chain release factor N(5)-glutamine methyltransferase [Planctomycetota bacterium]